MVFTFCSLALRGPRFYSVSSVGLISSTCRITSGWLLNPKYLSQYLQLSRPAHPPWHFGRDSGRSSFVGAQDLHRLQAPEGFPHVLPDDRRSGEQIPQELLLATPLVKALDLLVSPKTRTWSDEFIA